MTSEREVLDALQVRYGDRVGDAYRWAYAEHVPFDRALRAKGSTRIADAIAVDCWSSKGMEIHGHEVKVSRSDWLAELRVPDKAEAFRPFVDRWWLVVPDLTIVRDDLPAGWGLMLTNGQATQVIRRAPRLMPAPMHRAMLAGLLRATAKTAMRRTP